jgi:exopolysaccharide biosynthesis polyprenyl glycosylphosphotransferase
MLREFSLKRIVGFFLIDWLGSLAMLFVAGSLRSLIGNLPAGIIQAIQKQGIIVGGASGIAPLLSSVPIPVYLLVVLIWPLVFTSLNVYDGRRNSTLQAELFNILTAIIVSAIMLAGALFLTFRETSRLMLLLFVILDIALLESGRLGLWLYRKSRNGKGKAGSRAVLVIGAGLVGQNVVKQLQRFSWADFDIVGYLDDNPVKQKQLVGGLPVLGRLEQAKQVVQEQRVQHAVVALPPQAYEQLVGICQELHKLGVAVHVVPDLFTLSFPNASLDGFGGIPVIHLGQAGIYGWQSASKRVFDMLVVIIGLALIWPLLGLIALLIRIDSKGPVFYRQVRIGKHGRLFTMFKFRSMEVNADTTFHQAHVTRLIKENLTPEQLHGEKNGSLKLDNDPRTTRIGRVIRKTSLDELPQLFNVLLGEMSLVGPRPPLLYEMDIYQEWHKRRLDVLPGITGLWQVKGRNRVSFDEMVRMDIEYIQHQSLWLDFKILLQTPWALIHTRGAG